MYVQVWPSSFDVLCSAVLVTRFQGDKILSLGFLFSPVCLLQICERVWGLSAAAVKMYPLWCGFSFFQKRVSAFLYFHTNI